MQSVQVAKDRDFHMRWGAEDEARLEALSQHYALTAAQVLRMLIKRDADALGLATAAAPPVPVAAKGRPKSAKKR